MSNEMAICLRDRPADKLVRIHTERDSWDQPEVRYLRRKRSPRDPLLPLRLHNPDGTEEFVLSFGQVSVRILAGEDDIRIALSEDPPPPCAA